MFKKFLPLIASAAFFMPAPLSAAPITLNAHEASVRSTIFLVAKAGGLNVSVDGSIKGNISITLNNVDPIKALEIIAKTRNLKLVNEDGIFIFTSEHYTAIMNTYIFPIRYGDAETLRRAVIMSLDDNKKPDSNDSNRESSYESSNDYARVSHTRYKTNPDGSIDVYSSTKSGSTGNNNFNGSNDDESRENTRSQRVYVDTETNSIVLFGTPTEYERVKNLLETLDVELKQVSVEAKILAIDKEETKNLGVEWAWSSINGTYSAQSGRSRYSESSSRYSNESSRGRSTQSERNRSSSEINSFKEGYPKAEDNGNRYSYEEKDSTQNGNENQSSGTNIFSGSSLIQFGRSLTAATGLNWALSAQINALVTDGKAKILSRPNVMTIQGREAVINVGNSVPVPTIRTTNSTVTTSYDYRDAGIILKYTPRVNADGTITATIHTEVSTPQYVADMGAYRFNTRSADTTVTVRNGEPMIIGGLIGAEEAKSVSKIPFLGDLPILGALFRNHRKSKSESELVIFLTAHVLGSNQDETVPFEP